ncbi:hypothetical protein Pint_25845 [Pistacia integerrima]|uniref:Uncharacterized protein n=1 Tax=Pistacia integerrima TaxID=434235 RepID=A0ACC0YFH4_9ROSI|nr:hypothetical protein Pint_25845 [Pistacia integerrima]
MRLTRYGGCLLIRIHDLLLNWLKYVGIDLKTWLTIDLPEAKATLRRGASEADIQELEKIFKVCASSVFILEADDLRGHSEKYLFAYSIHMSLMPEGCIIGGVNFSSRRHWVIRANDVVVSDIGGEAVIGMVGLCPGETEFVYESCTPLPTSSGSVKGSFTFVPGR